MARPKKNQPSEDNLDNFDSDELREEREMVDALSNLSDLPDLAVHSPATPKKKVNEQLEGVLANMLKQFGAGAVMKLGDNAKMTVEALSTGVLSIDIALGVGGIPKGRIIEVYGPESSGKTTVALQAVARCQAEGEVAAFVDAEHALDPKYAQALGVDLDSLLISQPDNGEQALEIVEALVRSKVVKLIVVDSVAALVPRKELEGEMGDSMVGLHARLMSQAMRKLTGAIGQTGCTVIFINQIREKIGVMFGNPETTTGGRALRFYASVRMEVRRVETMKDKSGSETGNRVKVKIVKNKVAPPFKTAEAEIWFGVGFNKEASILDVAVEKGLIVRAGAWYAYRDQKIGQGRDNAVGFLKDNPEIADELDKKLRKIYFG